MERSGDFTGKIEIRKMLESDVTAVADIEQRIFSDAWSEDIFEESLEYDNQFFWVLTEDEKIVGYCGLMIVLDEGQILNIAVDEPYRRSGFGRMLMNAMLDYGRENGVTFFTLEVRESNFSAIKMYENFGFEETGRRKGYYTEPVETAVLMDLKTTD